MRDAYFQIATRALFLCMSVLSAFSETLRRNEGLVSGFQTDRACIFSKCFRKPNANNKHIFSISPELNTCYVSASH